MTKRKKKQTEEIKSDQDQQDPDYYNTKVNIHNLFEEKDEWTENLNSLDNDMLRGLTLIVKEIGSIKTQYGEALKIKVHDPVANRDYSFLNSGKVFNELFDEHVKINNKIHVFKNEKNHWRFSFVED